MTSGFGKIKQTTPENIYVSPAIYSETLTHLDPFTVHSPVWERPGQFTGKLISMLIETSERIGTEDELEQARR